MTAELVGYSAGVFVSIALLPQVMKTYKTKSAKDISFLWTVIFMIGVLLWLIYALMNAIIPLAVFSFIEFMLSAFVFLLKLHYG